LSPRALGADYGWLEVIKTIGALIALPTDAFVLVDRLFRQNGISPPRGNNAPTH
jgi:hypothetical protein